MVIAGIEASASTAALLALVLHRRGNTALTERIGIAVDTGSRGVRLTNDEREAVLRVLETVTNPPAALAEFHVALRTQHDIGRRPSRSM